MKRERERGVRTLRCEERQDEVPDPVGRCTKGDTLGSNPERERLPKVNPWRGTPEQREAHDLDDRERNQDGSTLLVGVRELIGRGSGRSESEVTGETGDEGASGFEGGSPDEHLTSAESVEQLEGGDGSGDGDSSEHQLDGVRVERDLGGLEL